MEQANFNADSEVLYPVLLIPKGCTTLETSCKGKANLLIDVNITSPDLDGNVMCIYHGSCNLKLMESNDVNAQHVDSPSDNGDSSSVEIETAHTDSDHITFPSYNQSKVWIDPVRSPHVYNSYDTTKYSICQQTRSAHITLEQHNTYITKNVYNCKESLQFSSPENFETKKFKKVPSLDNVHQSSADQNNLNLYEEDEFDCGIYLSNLPEEKEAMDRSETEYIGMQSENWALKQLMSSDIQSMSKRKNTILFLGHDSHHGQTIQKIAVNDPSLMCSGTGEVDHDLIENSSLSNSHQKKYQCDKCNQIFDLLSAFSQHMVSNHSDSTSVRTRRSRSSNGVDSSIVSEVEFICTECGKSLKNQEKFEEHCMGHGNPDLECNTCHKVFATRFTLRTHRKTHNREHPCSCCTKTFKNVEDLRSHAAKVHFVFMCESCNYLTHKYSDLKLHQEIHNMQACVIGDTDNDFGVSLMEDDGITDTDITPSPKRQEFKLEPDARALSREEEIQKANSVIAKVMSNKIFLLQAKKARKYRSHNKACGVCIKVFDRVGDLKRHLIEHIIHSTLAKTPVSKNGTLKIQCEVCQVESFTKVDKYKAHLREHAKLTLYKCNFCDKSFSDSSNFSKHKKIHSINTYFQCDLCQRKFNSKKMITQHMEYHTKTSPVHCSFCDKTFHFKSMLNKHVKSTHTKEQWIKFRCRFCHQHFKTLKEKWDHEWRIHNVRKMIVDCLICGCKFRKYSELKRHCKDIHNMEIPPAKKLLKKKSVALSEGSSLP